MNKDFDNWNELKKKLENNEKPVFFKEREIWWTNLGLNVGNEQCGKGSRFVRPILILKKFNNHFFFGVPLSSKQKDNPYYFNFEFKGKEQSAIMCQAKPISTKRLCDQYGYVGIEVFNAIRKKTGKLLNLS
jgi:mRNA interferase MazF